ncbi:MAG: CoA pyrophosphatase, partial [Chloroflexi bacterium]|nr:CoA pyrophosphatase [Chloroflexota bacterium]
LMPVVLGGGSPRLPARSPAAGASGRPAAVLVLVYPDEAGVARVVLTERTTRDGHHSGEVSFPGGKAEPDDADLVATALREATEEVGLDPARIGLRVVGLLERFWIPVSDFDVTPVVALADTRPVLVPAPDEVARIIEPPLAAFLPGAPIEVVERTIRDWPLRYGAYCVDGLSVWGATARILSQLGAIVEPRTS